MSESRKPIELGIGAAPILGTIVLTLAVAQFAATAFVAKEGNAEGLQGQIVIWSLFLVPAVLAAVLALLGRPVLGWLERHGCWRNALRALGLAGLALWLFLVGRIASSEARRDAVLKALKVTFCASHANAAKIGEMK